MVGLIVLHGLVHTNPCKTIKRHDYQNQNCTLIFKINCQLILKINVQFRFCYILYLLLDSLLKISPIIKFFLCASAHKKILIIWPKKI